MLRCGRNELVDIELATVRASSARVAGYAAIEAAEKAARRRMYTFYRQECPRQECGEKRLVEWTYRIALLEEHWDPKRAGYECNVYGAFRVVVECNAEPREPLAEIPEEGSDSWGGASSTGGPSATTPGPAPLPPGQCVVTNTVVNNTPMMANPGIAPLLLNVSVAASATDPTHTFAPGSVVADYILYSPGSPMFNWDVTLAAHKVGVSVLTDLTRPVFGLTVTPGPGTLTIAGTLNPGVGGLACMAGHEVYIVGHSTDSAGDSAPWSLRHVLR
jgi:hypothetical protein